MDRRGDASVGGFMVSQRMNPTMTRFHVEPYYAPHAKNHKNLRKIGERVKNQEIRTPVFPGTDSGTRYDTVQAQHNKPLSLCITELSVIIFFFLTQVPYDDISVYDCQRIQGTTLFGSSEPKDH